MSGVLAHEGIETDLNGQAILWGESLAQMEMVDELATQASRQLGAIEYRFPALISAKVLDELDWFNSFPHLGILPVSLGSDQANLAKFAASDHLDSVGALVLDGIDTAPITTVLTPAACYHCYPHFRGERLDGPMYITTRNTCFRREDHYVGLERQASFQMREIIAIGSLNEIQEFLELGTAHVDSIAAELGIKAEWVDATDPFFQPALNPKHLAQRLNPTKRELLWDGRLAIASVNLHQDHFGATFDIERGGAPAFSGCVAFGLERWLRALIGEAATGA